MPVNLTNPIFHDEELARQHLEGARWPDGPICPHCGGLNNATPMRGKSTRPGVYRCRNAKCRKPFSVTVGTVYERSHIPLHKWLMATHLLTASKKGISAHQLWRMLGFGSYRTAHFMAMRIREGMREAHFPGALGGPGQIVEADTTYSGGSARNRAYRKPPPKEAVMAMVERHGRVVSYHVPNVTSQTLRTIVVNAVSKGSRLHTDDALTFRSFGGRYAAHEVVVHSADEYVRGDVYTNSVEGFFSIMKRGIYGVYHHVSPAHLKRYLCEFDFRYNYRIALGFDDEARAMLAVKGISGKRLMRRRPEGATNWPTKTAGTPAAQPDIN